MRTVLLLGSEIVRWWLDGPVVVVDELVVFNRGPTLECTFTLSSLLNLFDDVDCSHGCDDNREDHYDLMVMSVKLRVVVWVSTVIGVLCFERR